MKIRTLGKIKNLRILDLNYIKCNADAVWKRPNLNQIPLNFQVI